MARGGARGPPGAAWVLESAGSGSLGQGGGRGGAGGGLGGLVVGFRVLIS